MEETNITPASFSFISYRNRGNRFVLNVFKRIYTYTSVSKIEESWRNAFGSDWERIGNSFWRNLIRTHFIVSKTENETVTDPVTWSLKLTVSKLNESHKGETTHINSYPSLKFKRSSTISYNLSIVVFKIRYRSHDSRNLAVMKNH